MQTYPIKIKRSKKNVEIAQDIGARLPELVIVDDVQTARRIVAALRKTFDV